MGPRSPGLTCCLTALDRTNGPHSPAKLPLAPEIDVLDFCYIHVDARVTCMHEYMDTHVQCMYSCYILYSSVYGHICTVKISCI